MTTNVYDILSKVYGARGLPFPRPPKQGDGTAIATPFGSPLLGDGTAIAANGNYKGATIKDKASTGSLIRKYDDSYLGTYQFLPATINGIDLPNAVVIISGEKHIEETDIVDVGTVFEKVFTRPYDISIIVTLFDKDKQWPEKQLQQIRDLWLIDAPVTLRCALTDQFIQEKENLVIKHIAVLDNNGCENAEVIQLDGMSNIDFELELV